jgi:flagellar biosynthesis/type III secretory pathway protein FliH
MAEPDRSGGRRPIAAVVACLLVAAVAGLSIGIAAKPDDSGSASARQEAAIRSSEATAEEVRRATARDGYRKGRRLGTTQGRRSGERAGDADGQIQARIVILRDTQEATSSAQSALAEISAPPPPVTP